MVGHESNEKRERDEERGSERKTKREEEKESDGPYHLVFLSILLPIPPSFPPMLLHATRYDAQPDGYLTNPLFSRWKPMLKPTRTDT